MSSTILEQTDRDYGLAASVQIIYDSVGCPRFSDFCKSYRLLRKELGERSTDSFWIEIIRSIRRLRFYSLALPLPFNHVGVASSLHIDKVIAQLSLVDQVYPSLAPIARELMAELRSLTASEENPLLDGLRAILLSPIAGDDQRLQQAAVVLKSGRFLQDVRAEFEEKDLGHVTCLDADEYRRASPVDRAVIIGLARWFPDYVFLAPRATYLNVLSYEWENYIWQRRSSFLSVTAPVIGEERRALKEVVEEVVEEAWPEMDWAEAVSVLAEDNDAEGYDAVLFEEEIQALPLALHGGLFVLLDASEDAETLVIDAERGLVRLHPSGISPGMYVLIRTDGSDDYIAEVADQILGEKAIEFRAAQRNWKTALNDKVKRSSLLEVSIELLDRGSNRAEETNLRHWISERSIATQDDEDFLAILRLLGMDGDFDYLRSVTRRLRAAHLKAGMLIRRKLLKRVEAVDYEEFERFGRMDFELQEVNGVRLTAFRVDAIAPMPIRTEARRIGRIAHLDHSASKRELIL